MLKLEPLEKTLDELADAEKVRRAQQLVSEPRLIGDHHYDNLPLAVKRWQGKWYEDKVKRKRDDL